MFPPFCEYKTILLLTKGKGYYNAKIYTQTKYRTFGGYSCC